MPSPWLSVILPTYNGEAYLAEALESVAAEADDRLEVVAIDDGSTDRTPDILRQFADRLPMQVLTRPREGNWVANTNRGLAAAEGEFACILHQDDLWMPGRLATIGRLLDEHGDLTLLLHPSFYIDASGRRVGMWRCPLPPGRPLPPELVMRRLLVQNFIAIPAPVFRRQTALDVGGMEPRWRYTADWDLWLKLSAAGPTLYHAEPLSCFRIHAAAQTVGCAADRDAFRTELLATLEHHLAACRERGIEPSAGLQRVARFSIDVNAALGAWLHGRRPPFFRFFLRWLALGPVGWHRYLRDSRITERVAARLRLRKTAGKDL